jgi:hypothetical protein
MVAVAAFASGATATALAGSAGPPVASHAAGVPAGPVGVAVQSPAAGQVSPAAPASPASPVSPVRPPSVSQGRPVLLAYSAASYARSVARRMLHRFHWSVRKQFRYLVWLWNRESGWNKYAATPTRVRMASQALPGSKMASPSPNWRSRPGPRSAGACATSGPGMGPRTAPGITRRPRAGINQGMASLGGGAGLAAPPPAPTRTV